MIFIRIISLFLAAVLSSQFLHASIPSYYAIANSHYLLMHFFSNQKITNRLINSILVSLILAVVLFYITKNVLMVFGIHYALTEAYIDKIDRNKKLPSHYEMESLTRFFLHLFCYLLILNSNVPLNRIPPQTYMVLVCITVLVLARLYFLEKNQISLFKTHKFYTDVALIVFAFTTYQKKWNVELLLFYHVFSWLGIGYLKTLNKAEYLMINATMLIGLWGVFYYFQPLTMTVATIHLNEFFFMFHLFISFFVSRLNPKVLMEKLYIY